MKVWIKLLLGAFAGLVLGVILDETAGTTQILDFLSKVVLNVGRYVIFPLVFFTMATGTLELKLEKKTFRVYAKILMLCILTTSILAALGAATVTLVSPERVPIIYQEQGLLHAPQAESVLLRAFPANLFRLFVESADVLYPLVALAVLIGLNLGFDPHKTKPVVQLFDSAGRVFYHVNSLVVEVFAVGLIAVAAARVIKLDFGELERFKQLLILVTIDVAIVLLIVYPLLLYLFADRVNPYRWLYATIAPMITAAITGDEFLSIGMLAKHGKESLGIKRMIGATTYPLLALLGRGGTALVSCTSFILILRSYSSLEIPPLQILQVIGFSILFSFFLASTPAFGAVLSLALLCRQHGIEEAYLILIPAAPILASAAAVLDVATSSFVTLLVGRQERMSEEIPIRDFV